MNETEQEFTWGNVVRVDPDDPILRCQVLLDDNREVPAIVPRFVDWRGRVGRGRRVQVLVLEGYSLVVNYAEPVALPVATRDHPRY
jgi:hypothetical protein